MATISQYMVESGGSEDGPFDNYREARELAQRINGRVVEYKYEFSDSIVLDDFTYVPDERGVVEVLDRAAYVTGHPNTEVAECGGCGRTWDDTVPTSVTPAPSGRCPFEYDHAEED